MAQPGFEDRLREMMQNNANMQQHERASRQSRFTGDRSYQQPHPQMSYNAVNAVQHTQHNAHPVTQHSSSRRYQSTQQIALDPSAYRRTGPGPNGPRNLYNPNHGYQQQQQSMYHETRARQVSYLDHIASTEVSKIEMGEEERQAKEAFWRSIAAVCQEVCAASPSQLPGVSLESFGSFRSGFANAGSDMDLVIVTQQTKTASASFSLMEDDLPRALEKKLLQLGYGARLLSRTRVPIIKLCEKPSASLLDRLREERYKWEALPVEKKYPHLFPDGDGDGDDDGDEEMEQTLDVAARSTDTDVLASGGEPQTHSESVQQTEPQPQATKTEPPDQDTDQGTGKQTGPEASRKKRWTRERAAGPLDFPKAGVGIQSDINFFNPLGIHNTQLLRCYALCDARVRPMILFVKSWAKKRMINSSYSGTLSSYGYVLMVLHYLVNVASPPVLPNLQSPWRPNRYCSPAGTSRVELDGWVVDFWRNEDEILSAVRNGEMSSSQESLGGLLLGFFQYYSSLGGGRQFHWMREVLALRMINSGVITKEAKGWVKAKTEEADGRTVQQRYLFCIEDPFELNHNVARTVTHNGIVAIRDEFRRAYRILLDIGWGRSSAKDGELFDQIVEEDELADQLKQTLQLDVHNAAEPPKSQPPATMAHNVLDDPAMTASQHSQRNAPKTNQATNQRLRHSKPNAARDPASQSLNMTDNNAFPALGPSKTTAAPSSSKAKLKSAVIRSEQVLEQDKTDKPAPKHKRTSGKQRPKKNQVKADPKDSGPGQAPGT